MMELTFEGHRQHVQQLIQASLQASDPANAVRRHLRRHGRSLTVGGNSYDLERGRVFLVAIGKAAVPMGVAAAGVVGEDLAAGILVTKKNGRDWHEQVNALPGGAFPSSISVMYGGHPVSDEDSVRSAMAVTELLAETNAEDLVLCLVSGGASAILAYPYIPLADWQRLNQALLESGCTINELNNVRRPLDRLKGGGLARYAAPAACVSLILSDVIGNPLEVIGSGPTVMSEDSPADALGVLARYGISSRLETAAWERIVGTLEQTGELSSPVPGVLDHVVVGDVSQAANAALVRGAQLGFLSQVLTTRLQGEAREVGRVAAAIAKDLPPGRCLIMGGETTVTVKGHGRGGRNQEMALAAAMDLEGWANTAIACFATDGEDGPTDAAGAVVTGESVVRARAGNLEPATFLKDNDSHTFFTLLDQHEKAKEEVGGELSTGTYLIRTGPTGTNVNDLLFILTYSVPAEEQSGRTLALEPHDLRMGS
jgi:hydroxypyruvate reductase